MKVLLIDLDSTIPNLALMKLSAHHKKMGDDVGRNSIRRSFRVRECREMREEVIGG